MFLPAFLYSPEERREMARRERENEKREFERHKSEAVDWDLWKTKPPSKLHVPLVIKAETYDIGHVLFDVKPTSKYIDEDPKTFRESGPYRYYHLSTRPMMPLIVPVSSNREEQPKVYFTDPVQIPVLVEKREGYHSPWRTWMGLSPGEIFSQRSGIRFCRGEVLIGGLGLGWFLAEVAKRKQVKKITVVEKDERLLDWYGYDLCKRLGAEVICDDVYNVIPKMPMSTRIALDIWPQWFDARSDRRLREHRTKGYDIWAWGAARGGNYW